jgi:hypothetical protein
MLGGDDHPWHQAEALGEFDRRAGLLERVGLVVGPGGMAPRASAIRVGRAVAAHEAPGGSKVEVIAGHLVTVWAGYRPRRALVAWCRSIVWAAAPPGPRICDAFAATVVATAQRNRTVDSGMRPWWARWTGGV